LKNTTKFNENIEVHELVYVYSFLVDGILVFNVPRATVRRH